MPIVIAHRGAPAYEPENTLRAVRHALNLGAPAIEVDVRRVKDRELVIMHDETVSRTTDGTGRVADLSLEELRQLDAGLGERVPTLREIASAVRDRALLVIEIKERGLWRDALDVVSKSGDPQRTLFVSFLADEIKDLMTSRPEMRAGILFHGFSESAIGKAAEAGASVAGFRHDGLTEHLVDTAHRSNLEVLAWTIDDPGRARQVAALGVDYIASNAPDLILAALSGSEDSSFPPSAQ